jgi:hypothetical protein
VGRQQRRGPGDPVASDETGHVRQRTGDGSQQRPRHRRGGEQRGQRPAQGGRRLRFGYDDDIEQARTAILDEGAGIDGVLADPEPSAPVAELGDSAVVLQGRVWIDPGESGYGAVRSQFVEAVKGRFDAEGVDMPYPNTELSGGVEVTNAGENGATADD